MDIAKIRKKLKEAKSPQQTEAEKEVQESSEPEVDAAGSKEESEEAIQQPEEVPQDETLHTLREKPEEESEFHETLIGEESVTEETPAQRYPSAEIKEEEAEPERAEEKQEAPVEGTMQDDIVELLTFKLSNEDYAFRVSDIEEILRLQRVASVPRAQEFVFGITSLRGKIIPLLDIKKRLNLIGEDNNAKPKILILKGSKGSIGVLVDRVIDVIRVSSDVIVEPPAHLTESELKFIEGIAVSDNRFVSIVRIEEVLNFNISGGTDERKA